MIYRLRVLLVVSGVIAVMAAVAISPAFAGKSSGTHGGGKHGSSTSSATLVISPNPPPAYSMIQISGCGYLVGFAAEIGFVTPTGASVGGVTVDSSGCVATTLYVYGSGNYSVGVQQYVNGGWVVEANASFTVQ